MIRFMLIAPSFQQKRTKNYSYRCIQSIFFAVLISFLFATQTMAATITSVAGGGTWNVGATWVGGVIPGLGDDVIIAVNASVTVSDNRSCNSLTWAAGTQTATRTLTINSGVTLNVTNGITYVNPAANFNKTISVAGTLNCGSMTMPTTGGNTQDCVLSIATTGTVTISGNLVMAAVFARNHIDMAGNAVINIGGNVGINATPTGVGGGFTAPPTTSTINLNGTSTQNVFLYGGASALGILKINNPVAATSRSTMTVTTLTVGDIVSSSVFKDSGYQVTSTGTLNLSNSSRFLLGRSTAVTTFPAFGTRNIALGTTVEYIASGATQTVSIAPNYANLVFSGVSKTIATGTLSVRGDFTINTGATCNAGTNNNAITIGGNFSNSGTFTTGTGLVTFNGTANQSITSSNTLTFNGSLTIANSGGAIVTNTNATIAIPTGDVMTINNGSVFYAGANIINGAGTFTLASGGTLGIGSSGGIAAVGTNSGNVQTTTARNYNTGANYIYNGTVNQAEGNGLPATVNNLTIDNTGGGGNNTVTMESTTSVSGNLSVLSGVLDLVNFTANRGSAGGTLTVSNGARLIIGGTNTLPSNFSTHSIGLTSTIEYDGTTNTIAALNSSQSYGNLVISASGATTTNSFSVSGVMTVSGSMIASAGTVTMNNVASSIANTGTLGFFNLTVSATPTAQSQYNTGFTVSGALSTSGAINFSPTGGTITMSGTSGSISNASGTLAFSSLTVSGTSVSSTGNFSVVTTMSVTGEFNPSATSIISGAGTLTGTGTVNVTRTAATPSFGAQYTITTKTLTNLTVDYNGAGAQTVSAADYGTLVISTNGSRTVTFENGGTVRVSNVFTPTATTTTYVVTGNTFEYNGSGAQTITAFTYNNLIISNAGAKTVLAGTTVNCQTIEINDTAILTLPNTGILNVQG